MKKLEIDPVFYEGQFSFPSLLELEKATEPQLRSLGYGYRAAYIKDSVKIVKSKGGEKWLDSLRDLEDEKEVRVNLIQLKGVGRKVADCTALFSMDCPQVIPVDTHVFQIAQRFGFIKKSSQKSSLNDKMH